MDSNSIALSAEQGGVTSFDVVDARTGARRNHQDVQGATFTWTPLPDGWAWGTGRRGFVVDRGGRKRTYELPDSLGLLRDLESSTEGSGHLFAQAWNRTRDSVFVEAVNLQDGSFTPWVAVPAVDARFRVLPDGTLFLAVKRTQSALDLYHVTAPGVMKLLGNSPRPGSEVTVSDDLKRATLSTSERHADAWMYRVVKN